MNKAKIVFLILLSSLLIPGILMLLTPSKKGEALLIYCAAGMRKPMVEIARQYEVEYGVRVDLQFAGSGTLLANAEASDKGDLYIAGDLSYINIAQDKGLVNEHLSICYLTAGLAVKKGNPLQVSALADLSVNGELRIVIANPEAASIGKFTEKILLRHNLLKDVSPRVLAMKPTVNELANDVKLGSADVAVVWDAVPSEALRFARYATARDKGLKTFSEMGYRVVDGDKWEVRPELVFFSGAMLNPAIRDSMMEFQEREGVTLRFVPNGCGILVSQMKAGARPDAYFSCDISFMDEVENLFGESRTVSSNDMVILAANNVKGMINSLNDLSVPGLRVGLAHPENSALGALTKRLLNAEGIDIGDNKKLDSATGDFLVNQLRAGSLDAVIVYRSNGMATPLTLTDAHIVEIDSKMAVALQPFAVGIDSEHKHLTERLFNALVDTQGREQFLKYGFQWKLSE